MCGWSLTHPANVISSWSKPTFLIWTAHDLGTTVNKINLSWPNVKICKKGSRIANHAWSNNPIIDFENASFIDKGTFRTRKTLEAWHTRVTPNADNNSCPLPGQYNNLFNEQP